MRILVTGGNGFIGSAVVRALSRNGLDVFATVRPGSSADRLRGIVPADRIAGLALEDRASVAEYVRAVRPDCCVHLAWCVGERSYQTSRENLAYLPLSLHLFTDLIASGCRRLVGIGTCFEYDISLGYLSERSPTKPGTLYAACKLAVAQVLQQLSEQAAVEWAWIRLFYLFGPNQPPDRLVPVVIHSIVRHEPVRLRGPEHIRDYLHVDDVAAAIRAVVQSDLTGPVNVGSGEPISVRALARTVARLLSHEVIIEEVPPTGPTDPPFVCANAQLLKSTTGWRPVLTVEEGLRQTIACFRSR